MNVAVVGPGAVGILHACLLARAGHRVAVVDRQPERASRLSRDGLTLEWGGHGDTFALPVCCHTGGRLRLPPARAVPGAAADDGGWRTFPQPELVLVCVKAYDTAGAACHVAQFAGPSSRVVSIQNGIGNAEALVAEVGCERVFCAATAVGATLVGEGRVRHAGGTRLTVAPVSVAQSAAAARLCALFRATGLDADAAPDAAALVWSKAILNAAINPLTAIHGVPNGALVEREDLASQLADAAREGQSVAVAAGVRLAYTDAVSEARRICAETAGNLSSMLQDVRRGRRTEIREIAGAIVAEAGRRGVPVPVLSELLARVLRLEI